MRCPVSKSGFSFNRPQNVNKTATEMSETNEEIKRYMERLCIYVRRSLSICTKLQRKCQIYTSLLA